MSYDAFAESIALIDGRPLRPIPRLSRRRRFVAMAVDVAGDVAATMFLRRGAGCVHEEVWQLVRRDGHWHLLGGGGGTHDWDEDLLGDRPGSIPARMHDRWNTMPEIDPAILVGGGSSGGVRDSLGRADLFPWSGRWISHTTLFASARVGWLRVDDREIPVPWHGRTLVTWVGRRSPTVRVHGPDGRHLGTVHPPR